MPDYNYDTADDVCHCARCGREIPQSKWRIAYVHRVLRYYGDYVDLNRANGIWIQSKTCLDTLGVRENINTSLTQNDNLVSERHYPIVKA